MASKIVKTPVKKETPLEATDRLLQMIEKSQSDIKILFDSAHSGLQNESKNAFLQYEKQFRDILRIPSQREGGTMIKRLSEFKSKLGDLYQDWGAEKKLGDIDDLSERARLSALYLCNFKSFCKTIGVLKGSYEKLEKILESPTLTKKEKQAILDKVKKLYEKYKKSSENIKHANHAINETWEDFFGIICTMTETNIKISDWQSEGGEGESPWVVVGWWTDAQGKHHPRSVRACDDGTGDNGVEDDGTENRK